MTFTPMASTYRPRLRAHVTAEEGKLVDGLLDRSYPLVGEPAVVAARLDGTQEWTALRASLVDDGLDAGQLDAALRRFLMLHLVEGAGDEASARLERVIGRTELVPTVILEGARFGCQGSGGCCTGYAFGPLTDADVARLDELDLATAFPRLAPPYVEVNDAGRFLRKDGNQCIFLAGDHRCGLHAAFGAEAKPGFCRLYPLDSFGTVEGIRVVDRGTCATFGVSARVGLPLAEDIGRVRSLLGAPRLHHPVVLVDGDAWDFSLYLRFTTAATALVRLGLGTAPETLNAIGRLLDALALVVSRCPLEPGQPDEVAARVLSSADARWYRPARPAVAARGLESLRVLLAKLGESLTTTIKIGVAPAMASRLEELVELLGRTAARLAAHGAVAGGETPAAALPAEVDDALRISLRQQLFGRHVLVSGHAGAGLLRIGLIQLLALAGARERAGTGPLTAADLSHGHMLSIRGLQTGMVDGILVDHEPSWRGLLDGLELATRIVAA